ncbi:MAG: hypothetical protein U0T73_08840 [Chitinophagales bacterium]
MKLKMIWCATAILALMISSCKKETATPDDPNIYYKSINKELSVPVGGVLVDSIDFNNDGSFDYAFGLINQGADTGGIETSGLHNHFQLACESLAPTPYLLKYSAGQTATTSSSFYSTSCYLQLKTNGIRLGLLDGETYVAFRFTTGTKYQYGWMKIRVNNTCTQFTILEYAYQLVPETAITIGAK